MSPGQQPAGSAEEVSFLSFKCKCVILARNLAMGSLARGFICDFAVTATKSSCVISRPIRPRARLFQALAATNPRLEIKRPLPGPGGARSKLGVNEF